MRYLLTLLSAAALLTTTPSFAQQAPAAATPAPAPTDIIVKRNGDEIAARVDEVGTDLIKYHRADNLQGPLFSMLKSEVFLIRYANGTRDVFNGPATTIAPPNVPPPAPPIAPPVAFPPPPAPVAAMPPPTAEDTVFAPISAAGPRLGMTVIGPGKLRQQLADKFGASNVLSLFGWQFETQLFQLPNGPSGLFEFVPIVSGLEQGLFLPSLSCILGLRGRTGLEVGVGPNLSLAGVGLVVAAGHTAKGKYINVPINFAVVPSGEGTRYSMLIGFTYHQPTGARRY